jgi:hypothetical protein
MEPRRCLSKAATPVAIRRGDHYRHRNRAVVLIGVGIDIVLVSLVPWDLIHPMNGGCRLARIDARRVK